MAKSNGHSVYVFDGFRLDRDKLMLYRGELPTALPPKAVETLAELVRRRDEIVGKDELIAAVWKDSVVEDSNLTQYLYLIRKTLGSRPGGTPYIETLRKRGYRFTADSFEYLPGKDAEVSGEEESSLPLHSNHTSNGHSGRVIAFTGTQSTQRGRSVAEASPAKRRFGFIGVLLAGQAILLTAIIAGVLWYNSSANSGDLDAKQLNVTRLTNGAEVMDATISPDGKYFAYHEADGKFFRIWLQQTGQATRHEIVPASERVPSYKTFTPDGQQLYYLSVDAPGESGTLYRVPTLGGPVTKVLTGMNSGVSFSPDGRQMVYLRKDGEGARYVIGPSDGSGGERFLHESTPGFGSAAWSPDGKLIAIGLQANSEDFRGGCTINVVKTETGKLTKFSDEVWSACGRLEWAPDGRGLYMIGTRLNESMTTRRDQVFYISYPHGKSRKVTAEGSRHQYFSLGVTKDGSVLAVPYNRSSQIWAMDPNGDSRSAVQLTTGVADGRSGIAPLGDGRVAYIARTGENINVWVMNADGSEQKQITDNSYPIEELRSGGDGSHLVFSGYIEQPLSHLFRINIDGGGLRQITGGGGREVDSSLSNDGKWIVYDSTVSSANKNELSLWKQSIDGEERVSLNRTDCQMPHFSPDDRYISCVREQQDILILSSTDGSLVRTLRVPQAVTLAHSLNFGARWTPDGKSVAYIVNEKGVANIWTHPIDGAAPKRLTDFTGGSIYHFAYSLDSKRLFVARGNQIRDAVLISFGDK